MNLSKSIKTLVLLAILFSISQPLAYAEDPPPTIPALFWGTVKVDGKNVPLDTVIRAKMDGVIVATANVEDTLYLGNTMYSISIEGDASMVGVPVEFFINDEKSDQIRYWNNEDPIELDLTLSNVEPVADAGEDQTVATSATAILDGSGSSDPNQDTPVLTYLWEQIGETTTITLSDPSAMNPSFIAPEEPVILEFSLVVTDSFGLSSTEDRVQITVVVPDFSIYLPLIIR
jgi:hypothetical protein